MTDQQMFTEIASIREDVAKLQDALPYEIRSDTACSCDRTGHCAHHAKVYNLLDEAYTALERVRTQLRFPNGVGDRRAF